MSTYFQHTPINLTNLREEMNDWFTYQTSNVSGLILDVENTSYTAELIKICTKESYLKYDCTKSNSFRITDSNIVSCEFFPILGLHGSSVNIGLHSCNKIEKFNFKTADECATGSNRNFFIYDDSNVTMKKFFEYRPSINRLELRNCTNEEVYDINKWIDINLDTYTLIILPHRRLINLSMLLHESITKCVGRLELIRHDSTAYLDSEIEIFNAAYEKYSNINSFTKTFEYSMDFVIALGPDFENDI